MIFIIQTLYNVLKLALNFYSRRLALLEVEYEEENRSSNQVQVIKDSERHFGFSSPVYLQRYVAVQEILADIRWKKDLKCVADFGCAEFQFFKYLKQLPDVLKVLEVDVDEGTLQENEYRLHPLTADYLGQRAEPLMVRVLLGSVSDPDVLLKEVDAVVGIEIIEHLYPDTLEALPYNIFGFIQPKLVVFTTPNADFNILFPNFKGFRHWDHKFEWTREQFENWAGNITERFPNYSVQFMGIGKGQPGTESLGCCSQLALFVKEFNLVHSELDSEVKTEAQSTQETSFGICTYFSYTKQMESLNTLELSTDNKSSETKYETSNYYKIVSTIEYPYEKDCRSREEKLLENIKSLIYRWSSCNSRFYNEEKDLVEIPLWELTRTCDGSLTTVDDVREVLQGTKFRIGECILNGSGERCQCVLYDLNSDDDDDGMDTADKSNGSDLEESDANALHPTTTVSIDAESDWESAETNTTIEGARKEDEVPTPSDPLVDSGYQKSLSNAEWSPQSPMEGHFDDSQFALTKLDVNDIKDSIKGAAAVSCAKKPAASTSEAAKKRNRKFAKKWEHGQSSSSSSSSEEEANQDVKSIAKCILYNSLNRLAVGNEALEEVPQLEQRQQQQQHQLEEVAVENGDLANNNRDNEGNNYQMNHAIDLLPNFHVENNANDAEDREVLDEQNRNVRIQPILAEFAAAAAAAEAVPEEPQAAAVRGQEVIEQQQQEQEEEEVNHASREALFDPNSQQDMLEDVPLNASQPASDNETEEFAAENQSENQEQPDDLAVNDNNPFPNWLLQLFGAQNDGNDQEEPHFYCQGDGLGVHPSIIEVDADTSTESSSTDDEAQAERTISDDDIGQLPADYVALNGAPLEVIGRSLDASIAQRNVASVASTEAEEFFDTIDDEHMN